MLPKTLIYIQAIDRIVNSRSNREPHPFPACRWWAWENASESGCAISPDQYLSGGSST